MIKALWLVRSNLREHPGGDTTQILRTAEALRANGLEVTLSSERQPDPSGYQLVHLFHLDRLWENLPWAAWATRARLPLVLSPIYWPSDEFDRHGRTGVQGVVSRIASGDAYQAARNLQRSALPILEGTRGALRPGMISFQRSVRSLLNAADRILPNSQAEQAQLSRRFGVHGRYTVVPNGVDPAAFRCEQEADSGCRRDRDTILCVGRIEPRKNQLALIRALEGTPLRIRLVGRAGRFSARYARLCRRAGADRVDFLPWLEHEALAPLYREAWIHACPSWYETPGLASLEAALSGCRLVCTERGSAREYFGEQAEYCTPREPASIRAAIMRARSRAPAPELARRVRECFSWQAAAEATLQGYDLALKHAAERPRARMPNLPPHSFSRGPSTHHDP